MPVPHTVTPNLGRYGSVGMGKQSAVGTKIPPTHFFRYNGGSPLVPTIVRTRDDYASGTLQQRPERVQGRKFEGKTLNFELDHAGLKFLFEVLCANSFAAGAQPTDPHTLTLIERNYDQNMPLHPVTVEAKTPVAPTRVTDVQLHKLDLTMNTRANFTGQVTMSGLGTEDMTDAAPAVLPNDVYQFRDHCLKLGAQTYAPEASTLSLDIPVQLIDAARGCNVAEHNDGVGFERNGVIALSGQFNVAGCPPELLAAYRSGLKGENPVTLALEWTLVKYDPANTANVLRLIKVIVPHAEINMVEPPLNMERIVTPVSWTAVSHGAPAFSIEAVG